MVKFQEEPKMHTPVLSVIIASYNHEDYIAETLESLEKQTFQDFEIVLIDDGSSDRTLEVARECNSRAEIYAQDNQGVIATRNRGIEIARGKYICFVDSDDIVLPRRFEKQVSAFEKHSKIGICYADALIIDETGKELGKLSDVYPVVPGYTSAMLLLNYCFMPMITVMVRAETLKTTGPFYGYGPLSDYIKWIEISHITGTYYDPEPLGCWRRHKSSTSKQVDPIVKYFQTRRCIREVLAKYPNLKSMVRSRIRKRFAGTYFLTGFFLASDDRVRSARKYYAKAVKTYPAGIRNWCGWFLSLLPASRLVVKIHKHVREIKLPW